MYQNSSGTLIIHRVIEEEDNGYEFKGDNNPKSDGVINKSQIKSEVHYKTGIGISENTCEAIFKPPIKVYEVITGDEITLPKERNN